MTTLLKILYIYIEMLKNILRTSIVIYCYKKLKYSCNSVLGNNLSAYNIFHLYEYQKVRKVTHCNFLQCHWPTLPNVKTLGLTHIKIINQI